MGVLDAPYQPRSSEWIIGGSDERITGGPMSVAPGVGTYGASTAEGDCAMGGCTPAYSFGTEARMGEGPGSIAPGPGAYHVQGYADGQSSQAG